MPTTTRGVPYPGPGDANNVPFDLHAIAEWIDANTPQVESYTNYEPSPSATTNLAAWTIVTGCVTEVDDVVTVSGQFTAVPAAGAAPVAFTLNLPNLMHTIAGAMLHGTGTYRNETTGETGAVHISKASGNGALFRFVASTTNNHDIRYTFTYKNAS